MIRPRFLFSRFGFFVDKTQFLQNLRLGLFSKGRKISLSFLSDFFDLIVAP